MTETQWPSSDDPKPDDPAEPAPATDPPTDPQPAKRPRKIRKLSPSSLQDSNKATAAAAAAAAVRVMPRPLSASGELAAAIHHLRHSDPALGAVIDTLEPPSFHPIAPPFRTLTRSIINQQLAYKAAATTYSRFVILCSGGSGDENAISPAAVLSLSPSDLRQIGISSRKSNYLRDLARKYHTGVLSDEMILSMDDKSVISMLTMVEGIGAWSVHMFLIFSLHRPDVLPVGDGGVRRGVQMLYGLEEIPRPSQMEKICERWRPYRSLGSWYMWRLNDTKANGGGGGGVGVGMIGQHPPLLIDNVQVSSSSLENFHY